MYSLKAYPIQFLHLLLAWCESKIWYMCVCECMCLFFLFIFPPFPPFPARFSLSLYYSFSFFNCLCIQVCVFFLSPVTVLLSHLPLNLSLARALMTATAPYGFSSHFPCIFNEEAYASVYNQIVFHTCVLAHTRRGPATWEGVKLIGLREER